MGGCESDRNIHVDEENNMAENGSVANPLENAASPLFGPEAPVQTEEIAAVGDKGDNDLTVMPMIMGQANAAVHDMTYHNAAHSVNDGYYVDEQTGAKYRYYETEEDARRAAETGDSYQAVESAQDEVYVMQQATVSVPVAAEAEAAPIQYADHSAHGYHQAGYSQEEPVRYGDHHEQRYSQAEEPVRYSHAEEQPAQHAEEVQEVQETVEEHVEEEQAAEESQPQKVKKDKKKKKKRSWKGWM